jgi:hypothetical protein
MTESNDDIRYRNRFRDGGNDEPMKKHQKKVWNRATGRFQKPAPKVRPGGAMEWWKEKVGGQSVNAKRSKKLKQDMKKSGT